MFSNRRHFGEAIERKAARYLQHHGLRLITRNYSCRAGEIDLIMQDAAYTLVFVEVRFRQQHAFGSGLESITPAKQQRLKRTAAHYLQRHSELPPRPCRFDVVGVSRDSSGKRLTFDWIANAFY